MFFVSIKMDNNHTTTLTPSDIHGKDYKPIKLNGLSHADMESAINDLLQVKQLEKTCSELTFFSFIRKTLNWPHNYKKHYKRFRDSKNNGGRDCQRYEIVHIWNWQLSYDSALLDVIVKITKDDSDEDYDSDLSVGDLNSDIDSSDEYDLRKRPVQPDYDIEEDLEDEYKPKRRRTANGAGSRKPRGQKIIDVPKDENGNYILPVTIGSTTILSLGEIIPDIHFYNQNYIFPVGYASQR